MKIFFFPCGTGVRCQNRSRFALATIDERGAKRLKTGRVKNKVVLWNVPIFRGISFFFLGLAAFFTAYWEGLNLSGVTLNGGVSEKVAGKLNVKKEGVVITILLLLSLAASLFLFGFVPSKLSFAFIGMSMNFALRNFLIALTKVAFLFLILLIFRFLPPMQDLYKFNGAANQVRLRDGSMKEKGKKDYYSPFNILNVVVFTLILSIFVITCVGISFAAHWNFLINLAIFLLCCGISYEICLLFEKSYATRMLSLFTNFFVCAKPSITHDEVARVAYSEIKSNFAEEEGVNEKQIPRSSLLTEMQTELEKNGKYDKADVEWIIATVLNCSREEAKLVRSFDQKAYREIMKATTSRAVGKPLSAIFGFVEFYGLKFDVNKKVLAPRMETELLVEEALKEIGSQKNLQVLDLGTGSGAIAVSIAKFSKSKVTAVDISKAALGVAKGNAQKNNVKVEFAESDLFDKLKKHAKFDIIVSNPPYIRTLDIEGLDEEVKNFDPRSALDGGEDGLDFYRRIASEAPSRLKKGGKIFLEIGAGQFKAVEKLLQDAGFVNITGKKDYSKIIRVVRAEYDKRRGNFKQN